MQPLGLGPKKLAAYHDYLRGPHDFEIEVVILNMEEKVIDTVTRQFVDGQVNIQRDGVVKRTATLTFFDPDHRMHLDTGSLTAGALFADRMIRVQHTVNVPGVGEVTVTPFVGPVVRPSRQGDELTLECQDKTLLAMEGARPYQRRKGRNAVEAIEDIMRDCTGERRFRFPKQSKRRLSRTYKVGWKPESSPWAVCQRIAARELHMQLIYACDGALVLRGSAAMIVMNEDTGLMDLPTTDFDITQVRNMVRVTGFQNKKKHIDIGAVAVPKRSHPHSPQNLGRNGVPRFLPELIDSSGIRKQSSARKVARDTLAEKLPMGASASFPGIPLFHLDYGDRIRVRSDWGDVVVPFTSGSIPLALGGDAEYGAQRRVSRPRRRA